MLRIILFLSFLFFFSCEDNEENPLPLDCAGVEGGTAQKDSCDVCDSDNSNDCIQDCAGEWGGNAQLDMCGECNGNNTSCTETFECDLNSSDYSDFMMLTAMIMTESEQSLSDTLYSFMGESCRGLMSPIIHEDSYLYYLTVYGNPEESDSLNFYYKNPNDDVIWILEQSVLFSPFASFGDPSDPFVFTLY